MSEDQVQRYAMSTEEYTSYAAGYEAAYIHVKEMVGLHGRDFDQEMILEFLRTGSELRLSLARSRQAADAETTRAFLRAADTDGGQS